MKVMSGDFLTIVSKMVVEPTQFETYFIHSPKLGAFFPQTSVGKKVGKYFECATSSQVFFKRVVSHWILRGEDHTEGKGGSD